MLFISPQVVVKSDGGIVSRRNSKETKQAKDYCI
jgi:hypothetical protein